MMPLSTGKRNCIKLPEINILCLYLSLPSGNLPFGSLLFGNLPFGNIKAYLQAIHELEVELYKSA